MPDGLVPQPHEQSSLNSTPAFEQQGLVATQQNALDRPLAAMRRYKWLLILSVPLSAGIGYISAKLVLPKFEAKATLWIDAESGQKGTSSSRGGGGPIKAADALTAGGYIELLKSYRVVDEVVRRLGLNARPAKQEEAPLLAGFQTAERFRLGAYALQVDATRKTWVLRTSKGAPVDSGTAKDSVGTRLGFRWVLAPRVFEGTGNRTIKFAVSLPRNQSIRMGKKLQTKLSGGSGFLSLTFDDRTPTIASKVLNTWIAVFLEAAGDLKRRTDLEVANILEDQLKYSEQATQDAEAAYQSFRVRTITLPTEGAAVASGVKETNENVMQSFFGQKGAYDNLRNDRIAMERVMALAKTGAVTYEGLLLIPSVSSSPGAEELRSAFKTGYTTEAKLTAERQVYTDEYPTVKELKKTLDILHNKTIPDLANQLLATLREREADYQRRIEGQSKELREIPARSIEEMRLERAMTVASGLYATLKNRHAETKLAAVSAVPDVTVLDTALAPQVPTKATRATVFFGGLGGGIALALGLVILLDLLDRRVRYTSQVTSDLGLVIAGAVPRVPKGGIQAASPESVIQVVEAFRSLRMQVMNSVTTPGVTLAVTSAAPRDGKSLISGNLAMSFAEAGLRTVLVDGDTRRGGLHKVFGLKMSGGLTDFLEGTIDETQLVRPTAYQNLSFVSCGCRNRRSPELLITPRLKQLVERLGKQFQVVIIDTPPLAAGIDGYALGTAAGNLLLVVRLGETERRLASAKLAVLERLPVSVIGAVLNDVPQKGEFQYYAYVSGYAIDHDEAEPQLALSGPR